MTSDCKYQVTIPEHGIDESKIADSPEHAAERVVEHYELDALFEPVRVLVAECGQPPRPYLVRAYPVYVYEATPEPVTLAVVPAARKDEQ